MNEKCVINNEDCSIHYTALGLCRFHYPRHKNGTDMRKPKQQSRAGRSCEHLKCEREIYTARHCFQHARHFKSYGNTWEIGGLNPNIVGRLVCREVECSELATDKKRCAKHHQQMLRGVIAPDPDYQICAIISCRGASQKGSKICHSHAATARRYGLSVERVIELVDSNPTCQGCGLPFGENRVYTFDHDHSCCSTKMSSCGKCVRGLLCHSCNLGIGYLHDNPRTLENLANYLRLNSFFSKSLI